MEIKTLKYFKNQISERTYAASFSQVKNMLEVYQIIDICDEAAIEFAKQFIDVAADKNLIEYAHFSVWKENINNEDSEWELTDNGEAFRANKQSILDIKQLIK